MRRSSIFPDRVKNALTHYSIKKISLCVLLTLAIILIVLTDYYRNIDRPLSTLFSYWGWGCACLMLALEFLFRLGLRTFISFLSLYFLNLAALIFLGSHSGISNPGVHVDLVYGFMALQEYFNGDNPLSAAGNTPSYAQFSTMLLSYLPAIMIGVKNLGVIAPFVAVFSAYAFLVTVLILTLIEGPFWKLASIGVLAMLCFFNRAMMISGSGYGYSISSYFAVAVFFLILNIRRRFAPLFLGIILPMGIFWTYHGSILVSPLLLVAFYVNLRLRKQNNCISIFPYCLILFFSIFISLLVFWPEAFFRRIYDVSLYATNSHPNGFEFLNKIYENCERLWSYHFDFMYRILLVKNEGSWIFLNIPIFGWQFTMLLLGSFTFLLMLNNSRFLTGYSITFIAYLFGAGIALNLVTDFSDYRWGALIYGLPFFTIVLCIHCYASKPLTRYLVPIGGLIVFNFIDLHNVTSASFGSIDYAPATTRALDASLRLINKTDINSQERVVFYTTENIVPIMNLYLRATAKMKGIKLIEIPVNEVCRKDFDLLKLAGSLSKDREVFLVHNNELCAKEFYLPNFSLFNSEGDVKSYRIIY